MATPISVIKNLHKYENKKRMFYRSIDLYLDLSSERALFDIYESDNISLIFCFSEDEYEIEIETLESGELEKVVPYKEFDFNFSEEEKAFFPGYFDLYITEKQNNERRRYYFTVHPRQENIGKVLYLRSYVNQYYDGLSLDLEKKRKMKVVLDESNYFASSFASYNFIRSHFSNLINYINRYVKQRPDLLIKKETISPKYPKVSAKSVKWLMQKGYTRNQDITKPNELLTKKTAFTLDNEQNRVFKSYIIFWDGELTTMYNNLDRNLKQVSKNIADLKEQIDEDKREKDTIQTKHLAPRVEKQLSGKIKDNEKKLNSLESLKAEYERRFADVKRYKLYIENVRYNSWISKINEEENYTHKRISNKELLLIKEYRDRYIGAKRRVSYGKNQKIDYFAEKSSPKLFETYLYILLINLLKNNGFEIDESQQQIDDLMYVLSSESKMTFLNDDGIRCEIIYDNPIENYNDDFDDSDFCLINSTHNRPDFILAFMDSSNKLTKAIVLDAKWRRLENIYSEYGDTDVMVSLKDYLGIGYYDAAENDIRLNAVSKVLAIYPDPNERNIYALGNRITYCGIKVGEEIETSKNYALLDSLIKEAANNQKQKINLEQSKEL